MVIIFPSKPSIIATSTVVGPTEQKSNFVSYFDTILNDNYAKQKTHEKAQYEMISEACNLILQKSKLERLSIDYFLSGDLVNQMTPTNFAAKELAAAFIGLFSACASSVSSVIVASLLTELKASNYAIAGASSHHNATEKQFRYPVLYGGQKPATAQWTVSAAGYCIVAPHQNGKPSIVAATVGKVVDFNYTDPFHMGGAMAPAAHDTIIRHLKKRNQTVADYDVIMTGDLGKIGLQILKNTLSIATKQTDLPMLRDAGAEFYGDDSFFQAGASGAGCSAAVFFSYIMEQFATGRFKRVLLVATGALLSPLSFQQGESIPCTAHAVEINLEEA